MKSIKKILACVALVFTLGTVGVVANATPAAAVVLTNCYGGTNNTSTGWVKCTSFNVSLAGVGQVRTANRCWIYGTSPPVVSGTYVGPWVGLNQTSSVLCPSGWVVWSLGYNLR